MTTATTTPTMQLYCVMSPWNANDSEEGTYEDKVWAENDEAAERALTELMVGSHPSRFRTAAAEAKWVEQHLENCRHLMVVLPVAETVKADLQMLLAGPEGNFDDEAKRDFETILALIGKRNKA